MLTPIVERGDGLAGGGCTARRCSPLAQLDQTSVQVTDQAASDSLGESCSNTRKKDRTLTNVTVTQRVGVLEPDVSA
ncbi:hypothetical protein GCM10027167_77230 [Nocardia heshunensis]